MRVCVVGGGGREHALAWTLAQTAEVVVAPGNPGTDARSSQVAAVSSTELPPEEVVADLWVIGPEAPLVAGLADRLRAGGRRVLGPGADGARLEGSKAWMKEVLAEAGVPTAAHLATTELSEARRWLSAHGGPYVVKTDGLAAGKGVLVTGSLAEAVTDVESKLSGRSFGEAGRKVVLEEALDGPELSVLAVCDGRRCLALPAAQDFKRAGEGGTGANTGGMGAYSPVDWAGPGMVDRVMDEAVEPLLTALRRRGIDYRGVLYAGLMLTRDGPRVVEFNARFGDPEAQVVLPRIGGDLAGLLLSASEGHLAGEVVEKPAACVGVVMASPGYPGSPRSGDIIEGVDEAEATEGVLVFHAGTARDAEGRLVSAGGRVLDVVGSAATLAEARALAYAAVDRIRWPEAQVRRDIALAASCAGDAARSGATA